ncbi:MAG: hypothetical protein ACK4HQ_05730, partial [Brevinematales bacterium]
MFFRIGKLSLGFLLISVGLFWGEVKQSLGIAGFVDLSSEGNEVIGTILQNSLLTVLQKEKRFDVMMVTQQITNLSHAREVGMAWKLDTILYGSYRQEGRSFVVAVEIYDILENELRFSRVYRGEYSRNIFDTVDVIALQASEEIKKVLPPLLTEEDIARAQAQRRKLYEQEVSIRREMRLSGGVYVSSMEWICARRYGEEYWSGNVSARTFLFSLSARLEMLRFTFVQVSLPWVPTWYVYDSSGRVFNWQ